MSFSYAGLRLDLSHLVPFSSHRPVILRSFMIVVIEKKRCSALCNNDLNCVLCMAAVRSSRNIFRTKSDRGNLMIGRTTQDDLIKLHVGRSGVTGLPTPISSFSDVIAKDKGV